MAGKPQETYKEFFAQDKRSIEEKFSVNTINKTVAYMSPPCHPNVTVDKRPPT